MGAAATWLVEYPPDIDRSPNVAAAYAVRGIPTFMLFQGGLIVARIPAEGHRHAQLDRVDLRRALREARPAR
ncbi:thioredoxin family protein [Sorangium cellulosum]|uniref:thioredoxin family protein n=1 Tax=Sorangium cellulosum TaxID=56 RepID=UPI003D9A3E14